MDLRVYVDGVARIICDLTRTTTVHDIIIALAQYKGKAGRYSLIQRAPDGTHQTLSPHQLTCELIHHSDWAYILQQNPSNKPGVNGQKRSQSLDGRKTPQQQAIAAKFFPLTSSSEHIRTVQNTTTSHGSIAKRKRSNIHQVFPSVNNNHSTTSLRTPPIPNSLENQFSRPVSTDNSAFHLIHNPTLQQQQQYTALVQLLKKRDGQVEQQEKDLTEQQREIDYRESIVYQTEFYQDAIEQELKLLEEHDRQLFAECQTFAQEYSVEKLDWEVAYHQQLQANYARLQEQLARCSATLEQKRQLQVNIEQTHGEIQQMQTNLNNDKKEIIQCEHDLEHSNTSLKQQEDLGQILHQRSKEIERFIRQYQKQILELEIELIKLNKISEDSTHSSYHFHPPPSSDLLTPVDLQLLNSTLLKFCPSGIWI